MENVKTKIDIDFSKVNSAFEADTSLKIVEAVQLPQHKEQQEIRKPVLDNMSRILRSEAP